MDIESIVRLASLYAYELTESAEGTWQIVDLIGQHQLQFDLTLERVERFLTSQPNQKNRISHRIQEMYWHVSSDEINKVVSEIYVNERWAGAGTLLYINLVAQKINALQRGQAG